MEKAKKQKSKVQKIIEGVLTGIFGALLAVSVVFLISGKISANKSENKSAPTPIGNSYLPILVLTDSMEPDYKVDTALFVRSVDPEEIVEGFNEGKTYDLTFFDKHTVYPDYFTEETTNYIRNEYKNPKNLSPTLATRTTVTHRLFYIQVNLDKEIGTGRYYFFVEGINTESEHIAASNQYQVFTENELYGYVTGHSNLVGWFFNFVSSPFGLIILLLIPSLYMVISSLWSVFKKEEEYDTPTGGDSALSGLSKKDQERLKEELLNELMSGYGGDK